MFRKIFAYLLLLALTSQCLGNLGVLAWFQINRSYIANVLCENRDKPTMHCDGQCVLMKKLKKLDESEKSSRDVTVSKTDVTMIMPEIVCLKQLTPTLLSGIHPPYGSHYTYLYISKLFLPPKTAYFTHLFSAPQ